jgi:hypothetical protein
MLKQIQFGNSCFTCSVGSLFSAEFDESSFNGNKIDLLFHRVVDDIAETVYYAASAPAHIQIAEVLLMPTYQATGTISYKKKAE